MKIVKVQIPIVTNDPHALALVYAKGRKGMAQQKLDHATLVAMGDDIKGYFRAELGKDGRWHIGGRVKDQDW